VRDYLGDVYTEVFVAVLGWAVGIGYLLGVSVALRRHHYLVAKLAAAFAIPAWPVAGGMALLLGAALTKSPVRATQVGSRDSADE
jgi:hypothetical protein